MNETTLSLAEAAQLLTEAGSDPHAAEAELAEAIEGGRLHASVKRWATEQWEGRLLPGNLNRRETYIARADLQAWLARRSAAA